MLTINYRTLQINFPNHDDLLKSEINELLNRMDVYLDHLSERLSRGKIKEPLYASIRLCPSTYLTVFVEPKLPNNPYLCVYDTIARTYSTEVSSSIFMRLKKQYVMYNFEDKVTRINTPLSKQYMTKEIQNALHNKAIEYDER